MLRARLAPFDLYAAKFPSVVCSFFEDSVTQRALCLKDLEACRCDLFLQFPKTGNFLSWWRVSRCPIRICVKHVRFK